MIFLPCLRLAYGRSAPVTTHMSTGDARPKQRDRLRELTALVVPAQTGHRNGWEERNANGPGAPGCHTGLLAGEVTLVLDLHEGSAGDGIPAALAV